MDRSSRLRSFMGHHVFAVWDFMSLVARLRQELTGTTIPWMPPRHPQLARFINEIVLDEESDHGPCGTPKSHFDLYRQAMDEVEAPGLWIDGFLGALQTGCSVDDALELSGVPLVVRRFVSHTLDVAANGTPLEVAACFLLGRETVIPEMFQSIVRSWPARSRTAAPQFLFYLERHIELDGGTHAELGTQLLEAMAERASATEIERAQSVAETSIRRRIDVWDAVLTTFESPASREI